MDVERYSRLRAKGVSVERFDLCADCHSLPSNHYEECFSRKMSPDERRIRFHHPEHFRNFGRDDLLSTLGMIFRIEGQLKTTLLDHFSAADLERYNIPDKRWRKFNGANLFMLRKEDLILSEMHSGAR